MANDNLGKFLSAVDAKHAAATSRSVARYKVKAEKRATKGIRKQALPVAAGTEGILKGVAKAAEGTLNEDTIRMTQQSVNRAKANTEAVKGKSTTGKLSRVLAGRTIKKGIKAGVKEGSELGAKVFKKR